MIKNYLAKDMYEAMVTIRQELGNDAVIVSNRYVRQKGFLGFLKRKQLEVTAAVDVNKNNKNGLIKKYYKDETNKEEEKLNIESLKQEIKEEFIDEVRELKQAIHLITQSEAKQEVLKETNESSQIQEEIQQTNLGFYQNIMREMDFHSDVIADFEKYCENIETDITKMTLYEFIKERVSAQVEACQEENLGRIRMFIGPTGVGKTTSIAKLASHECLQNKKNVGLITVDTYRIGAVEQLKIYANILGIPIKVVFSPSEIGEAIESFADKDIIFIDSTGRSQKNIGQLNELEEYIKGYSDMHKYLVLSMTTKNTDFMKLIGHYKTVGFDSLILSKFDETYSFGNILNASYVTNKPISYISIGQNVPDDIEHAKKDQLFKYLWGEI